MTSKIIPLRLLFNVAIVSFALTFAIGCSNEATSDVQEKDIQWLFVQNSESVTLNNGMLRMHGINPVTLFFSDRPERIAAHGLTSEFVSFWSMDKVRDNFKADPPNATLSVVEGNYMDDIVLTLSDPVLKGSTLSYSVTVIEGKDQLVGGPSSLFIDVIGMPLTPLSVAGVARRANRRAIRRANDYDY